MCLVYVFIHSVVTDPGAMSSCTGANVHLCARYFQAYGHVIFLEDNTQKGTGTRIALLTTEFTKLGSYVSFQAIFRSMVAVGKSWLPVTIRFAGSYGLQAL